MKGTFAKYTAGSLISVGFLMAGSAAFAQQTMAQSSQSPAQQTQNQGEYQSSSPQSSYPGASTGNSSSSDSSMSSGKVSKQELKDCVTQARQNDSTLTQSDAKKACQQALKAQKSNQDSQAQPH